MLQIVTLTSMIFIVYIVLYILGTICNTYLGAVAEDWKLLEFETWSRPIDFRSCDMTEVLLKLRMIPQNSHKTYPVLVLLPLMTTGNVLRCCTSEILSDHFALDH